MSNSDLINIYIQFINLKKFNKRKVKKEKQKAQKQEKQNHGNAVFQNVQPGIKP